jgi:hypothetical protein
VCRLVGALLQYANREQVFRLIHTLGERCAESAAAMHFHLDPAAVNDRTVAVLSLLMDAVVDVESEAVTVRPELTGTGESGPVGPNPYPTSRDTEPTRKSS